MEDFGHHVSYTERELQGPTPGNERAGWCARVALRSLAWLQYWISTGEW